MELLSQLCGVCGHLGPLEDQLRLLRTSSPCSTLHHLSLQLHWSYLAVHYRLTPLLGKPPPSVHGACVCMVPLCAWCLCVHGACVCTVPVCAWCLCVHGACVCMVPLCAWCLCVYGASVCMVPVCAWCLCVHGASVCMVLVYTNCLYRSCCLCGVCFKTNE